MTDPAPGGTAEAVRLLLAELEATVALEHDLNRRARAAELARKRLTASLDPAISALGPVEAERLRPRLLSAVNAQPLIKARKARTRFQALVEYLAANSGEVVKVAEITTHLERSGFCDLPAGYASDTLRRLEGLGLVAKVRYARYRVNEAHPEIIALHLRALEADARFRAPPEPTRAREEAPRFSEETETDETQEEIRAEIEANKARIAALMAGRG